MSSKELRTPPLNFEGSATEPLNTLVSAVARCSFQLALNTCHPKPEIDQTLGHSKLLSDLQGCQLLASARKKALSRQEKRPCKPVGLIFILLVVAAHNKRAVMGNYQFCWFVSQYQVSEFVND